MNIIKNIFPGYKIRMGKHANGLIFPGNEEDKGHYYQPDYN
jgi:hypothetical protein